MAVCCLVSYSLCTRAPLCVSRSCLPYVRVIGIHLCVFGQGSTSVQRSLIRHLLLKWVSQVASPQDPKSKFLNACFCRDVTCLCIFGVVFVRVHAHMHQHPDGHPINTNPISLHALTLLHARTHARTHARKVESSPYEHARAHTHTRTHTHTHTQDSRRTREYSICWPSCRPNMHQNMHQPSIAACTQRCPPALTPSES